MSTFTAWGRRGAAWNKVKATNSWLAGVLRYVLLWSYTVQALFNGLQNPQNTEAEEEPPLYMPRSSGYTGRQRTTLCRAGMGAWGIGEHSIPVAVPGRAGTSGFLAVARKVLRSYNVEAELRSGQVQLDGSTQSIPMRLAGVLTVTAWERFQGKVVSTTGAKVLKTRTHARQGEIEWENIRELGPSTLLVCKLISYS